MAGKVRDHRGVRVVTHVVHVFGFPVWPLATYVEIVPQASACVRIANDDVSFIAAYARTYAPLLFGVALVAGRPAEAAISAAIALGSFLFLGRLTPRATRLRDAYALLLDHGFDPAWKEPADRKKLREECEREIALTVDSFAPETMSYRVAGTLGADAPWDERLSAVDSVPRLTLAHALVLARIEEVEAESRREKKKWIAVQDDLLSRFLRTKPLEVSPSQASDADANVEASPNARNESLRAGK